MAKYVCTITNSITSEFFEETQYTERDFISSDMFKEIVFSLFFFSAQEQWDTAHLRADMVKDGKHVFTLFADHVEIGCASTDVCITLFINGAFHHYRYVNLYS